MSKPFLKRLYAAAALFALTGSLAAQTGDSQAPAAVRIKSGTKLMLDLYTPLNSATARPDDEVWFTMRSDLRINGRTALFRGAPFRGSVVSATPAVVNGDNKRTEIQIRLEEIPLAEGGSLAVAAEILKVKGETLSGGMSGRGSIQQATSGAMLGRMIGRGAKGAAIGAAVAVGVEVLGEIFASPGPSTDVDLPAGSVFEAKLERPLDIPDALLLAKAPPAPILAPLPPSPDADPAVDAAAESEPSLAADAPIRVEDRVPAFEPLEVPPAAAGDPPVSESSVPDSGPAAGRGAPMVTLSVNVNLVQVDAIVRDRNGRPMTSLRKEDFRVFEDGAEQQVQLFSRDELPLAIALVIDRSGSVAPLMSTIQTAAYQALQLLKAGDEVCLFSFAGDVELLEELTDNRQKVANRIGSIRAGGGTNIVDALHESMRYLEAAAPDRKHAVILISDNAEGQSMISVEKAVGLALETESVVYSVKVGDYEAPGVIGLPRIPGVRAPRLPGFQSDPVRSITKETGGEIFDVDRSNSIGAVLMTAVSRLKLRYTLGYASDQTSDGASGKKAYHRIQVRLVDRFGKPDLDYEVHARSGYYDAASN